MDSTLFSVLWVGGFAGAAAAYMFLIMWRDTRRTQTLARVATQLGFTFSSTPIRFIETDNRSLMALGSLHLFLQGSSGMEMRKEVSNLMEGEIGQVEVLLFDYRYHETGHYDTLPCPTVAALHVKGMDLPNFELRPKGRLGRIRKVGESQHALGSAVWNDYVLSEGKQPTIEALLNEDVSHLLREQQGWYVEGWVDRLIIYRKKVKPEEIRHFLDATIQFCNLLARK